MLLSTRRHLLAATSLVGFSTVASLPGKAAEGIPWAPNEVWPPATVLPGPWVFFTHDEAVVVEAIAERLIPSDELGPSGREAGCAIFIDRQLAGPYGRSEWLYMEGPFPADPLPSQGNQSPYTPQQRYRLGLAALADYCHSTFGGKGFHQLAGADQDKVLSGLQGGSITLKGFSSKMLFETVYGNVIEGYFADPIYGGNREMCGWKMIGFPGTRYDYREAMANPNKPYTLPPVSLKGRPDWNRSPA